LDDDGDLVPDTLDFCATGDLNWESNLATDFDADGCNDQLEDRDDDNDGVEDSADTCDKGVTDWISEPALDYDEDGCRDSDEDLDDDNDGLEDLLDSCQKGDLDWTSGNQTDSDADGCQDLTEDSDHETPIDDNESGVDCNRFITTCDETPTDNESDMKSDVSETKVQSMIVGLLAMAVVPTVLGGLLIAYRVRW